jgi:hypothetical protein
MILFDRVDVLWFSTERTKSCVPVNVLFAWVTARFRLPDMSINIAHLNDSRVDALSRLKVGHIICFRSLFSCFLFLTLITIIHFFHFLTYSKPFLTQTT